MMIQIKQPLIGRLNNAVVKQYPELENLEVTPSLEEQNFKSEKYGYENVKVNAIETEDLNVVPTLEKQSFKGLYRNVNVGEVVGEEASIMPGTETQTKQGIFTSVTLPGEENYKEENIRAGTSMWGKIGTMEGKGRENAVIETNGTSNWFLKELGTIDCKSATSLSNMFSNSSSLVKADAFTNTHKCTEMNYMFADCYKLEKAPVMDTSSVQKMPGMFRTCTQLRDVPEYNAEKVINVYNTFSSCSSLENFGGLLNFGKAFEKNREAGYYNYELNLSACTLLTHESLMNVINKLYNLNERYAELGTSLRSQNLKIGETNLAKLNSSELTIATSKGWTVS